MKNKKGFTLVELLAVIVILGVLLLIAVPAVSNIINSTKKKTFVSTVKMALDNVETLALVQTPTETCYLELSTTDIELDKGSYGNIKGFVVYKPDEIKNNRIKAYAYDEDTKTYINGKTLTELNGGYELKTSTDSKWKFNTGSANSAVIQNLDSDGILNSLDKCSF